MLDLDKVASEFQPGEYSRADFTRRLRRLLKTRDTATIDGVLSSLQHYGVISFTGQHVGHRWDTIIRNPDRQLVAAPKQQRTVMEPVQDEWGDVREFPTGPLADAERNRVRRVLRARERARLEKVMNDDDI